MGSKPVTQFCCCMNNLLASKVWAVLCLIWIALSWAQTGFIYHTLSQNSDLYEGAKTEGRLEQIDPEPRKYLETVYENFPTCVGLIIVNSALYSIAPVLLAVGVFKRNRTLLLVWLVIQAILIVWGFAIAGYFIHVEVFSPIFYAIQFAGFLITIWIMLIIYGARRELIGGEEFVRVDLEKTTATMVPDDNSD